MLVGEVACDGVDAGVEDKCIDCCDFRQAKMMASNFCRKFIFVGSPCAENYQDSKLIEPLSAQANHYRGLSKWVTRNVNLGRSNIKVRRSR